MNYYDDIERSIKYIEMHLKEDLTANEIATHVGYSVYHFCRVFSLYQGTPLMDYVRKKRLLQARKELLSNSKIIDIAFNYGFKTASGFSKAFRKEFGYSPTVYIARNNSLNNESIPKIEGFNLNPTFTKKLAFKVAGYGIKTNISNGYMKDIAAYWDTYTGENLESKMYKQLNPPKHGEVGLCVSSSDQSNLTYLFGLIVDDYLKVTSDMMTFDVPESAYVVFTTPPVNNIETAATYDADPLSRVVKATWKYIFEEWFQDCEYVFDETRIDFEFYDERCHSLENAVMEIYVPIKKKS